MKKKVIDFKAQEALAGDKEVVDIFRLKYLHVTSGTTVIPIASVKLTINGRPVQGAGYGNGPIDATFNTIAKLTGAGSELLKFSVSALTGGTDAHGEVTVRLNEDGLTATGRAADPDIIIASAKAYIKGLNRLEYLKAHPVIPQEVA